MSEVLDPRLAPVEVEPGETLHVFKCRVPFNKYYLTDGRACEFLKEPGSNFGVYYTNQQDIIDELNYQISKRHPLIFVDPNQKTILEEERDPEVRKRAQIVRELMADGWFKQDPTNDMGNSVNGPLKAASTSSMAAVAAGGDGASDNIRLNALASQLALKQAQTTARPGIKKFVPPTPVVTVAPTEEEILSNKTPEVVLPGGLSEKNIDAPALPPEKT